MFCDFTTTTHAKWILTGEHTVLRGAPALVFPLLNKTLRLSYKYSKDTLSITCKNLNNINLEVLLQNVLQSAFKFINKDYNELSGHFDLICEIPIGTGLGASGALCVAIARWLNHQNLLATNEIESFSKKLENIFHGKSSGLDIAGVNSDVGLIFQKGTHKPIHKTWDPIWYLSFSDQLGLTSQCIEKIETLFKNDPVLAKQIDEEMSHSVQKATLALENNTNNSLSLLQEAINLGCFCFKRWNLINTTLETHMNYLYSQGAIAVKPTGSGGGGHILSLWDAPPPKHLTNLITI